MAETPSQRLERMHEEYAELCKFIPDAPCQLNFKTPFQLLIATVLSAQATDKRVNMLTPELFEKFGTPETLASASPQDVDKIIHSLGFYNTKTQNIIAISQQILTRFHGEVPQTMEDLCSLPGVGRKTASVVLGNAFGVPAFPVDTHVIRVTGRLHWRDDWMRPYASPEKIEKDITACFPPDEWVNMSHRLIIFGRNVCHARKPNCAHCPLRNSCPSADMYLKMEAERAATRR